VGPAQLFWSGWGINIAFLIWGRNLVGSLSEKIWVPCYEIFFNLVLANIEF
jgi:hypothetical protein